MLALYNNFELYNPFISVKLIVWAMFIGFVLAALMAVYNKRVIGGFVKDVLAQGCLSEKDAKTLVDLGYGKDWVIKNALRSDTVLRRYVTRVRDEDELPVDTRGWKNRREDIDFSYARFYIPEEKKYGAEVRYARRGTDLIALGTCVLIFAVAAFAALVVIPELLTLVDNFITLLSTGR